MWPPWLVEMWWGGLEAERGAAGMSPRSASSRFRRYKKGRLHPPIFCVRDIMEAPPAPLKRSMTSRRAVMDANGDEVVKVNCFCRFMTKFTWVVALISFLVIVLFSGAAIGTGFPELVNTGWRDATSIVAKRGRAKGLLEDDAYQASSSGRRLSSSRRRI